MISIEQINGEIAALEEQVPTHIIMQKLASLYTVRDHMGIRTEAPSPVVVAETFPDYGMSEFLQTIEGKNIHDVMLQVDELVEAVQVFNPRLTSNFFDKLKTL